MIRAELSHFDIAQCDNSSIVQRFPRGKGLFFIFFILLKTSVHSATVGNCMCFGTGTGKFLSMSAAILVASSSSFTWTLFSVVPG